MINAISNIVFGVLMNNIKKSRAHKISSEAARLFLIFVFVSFCGWGYEVGRTLIMNKSFPDRGLLTLPLCPIYGISVVLIYLLVGTPAHPSGLIGAPLRRSAWWERSLERRAWLRLPLYFAFVTLAATASELATGLCAKALGSPLWDYSGKALNLFGVVCLEYSLYWGLAITAFMLLLWRPIHKIASRLSSKLLAALTLCTAVPILVDFTVSIIHLALTGKKL